MLKSSSYLLVGRGFKDSEVRLVVDESHTICSCEIISIISIEDRERIQQKMVARGTELGKSIGDLKPPTQKSQISVKCSYDLVSFNIELPEDSLYSGPFD